MNAPLTTSMPRVLPAEHRQRLLDNGREVAFTMGARIFDEGGRADRFWIVRTGTVELHMRVPGRRPAVIESLGHDELVGCSWLFAPHMWQLGARASTPVRAYEFDAVFVRALCDADPEFGRSISQWVGGVVAHRLHAARTRLLDLYGPYGSGGLR
ncbi:regulator [Streptomyces sp. Ru71]|uniref:cyclic nucleotide-binding domain-containing protein n=1 Tax=Streptomyces sp. Ru71 TaxID=2080746 RepID=UPI000CDE2182|nr:cyclic nucleotide-binding domain-containing protein [Streptomyces sp. Ru71]POX55063.1 regulator [Streptomyces sp. Ru71]